MPENTETPEAEGTETPAPEPASETPASESSPPEKPPADKDPTLGENDGTPSGGNSEAKYTQADIDRIVAKRLTRSNEKHATETADLKAKADKWDETERANMSATERLQAELETANSNAETLRQQAETSAAHAKEASLRAQVVSEASGRFIDPQAVYQLADLESLETDDSGNVTGIAAMLDKLAEEKSYLLGKTGKQTPPVSPTNPPKGGAPVRTDEDRRADYFGGAGKASPFFEGGGVEIQQKE